MRKRKNRKYMIVIYIAILFLICGFFSTIFALIYATNSNIIHHITINNIPVSGLSRVEAETKFEEILKNIMEDEIILKHGEHEKTFTLKRVEMRNRHGRQGL